MAESARSQLQPRAGAWEGELTGTGTDPLDVGEQIRRLQALVELRAAGTLTDAELTDLKRRVLSPGSDAPLEARHAGNGRAPQIGKPGSAEAAAAGNGHAPPADTQRTGTAAAGGSSASVVATKAKIGGGSGPVLSRRAPKGSYVAFLKVEGTIPVTCRAGANKRPSYLEWKKALQAAAAKVPAKALATSGELFSLQIELRLYASGGPGSDLDNYVKPIQDALAERGVFGTAHKKSR